MSDSRSPASIQPHALQSESPSRQVRWVADIAEAVATLGTDRFWKSLLACASGQAENQGGVIFQYTSRAEPHFLFGDFNSCVSHGKFHEYRKRAYLLDPFYLAYRDRRPNGIYRLRDLTADRFFYSEYFRTYYAGTGLSDEIGIFSWIKPDELVIVTLVRRKGAPGLSAAGVGRLRVLEPLMTSLVLRHAAMAPASADAGQQPKSQPATGAVDQLHFGAETVLTPREAAIANLILRGHSSPSMALLLGISPETVKVHRRHIYRKLHISSQAELFSLAVSRPSDRESA
jgi:DNA-binding CsgD family transcriptional regulator